MKAGDIRLTQGGSLFMVIGMDIASDKLGAMWLSGLYGKGPTFWKPIDEWLINSKYLCNITEALQTLEKEIL